MRAQLIMKQCYWMFNY